MKMCHSDRAQNYQPLATKECEAGVVIVLRIPMPLMSIRECRNYVRAPFSCRICHSCLDGGGGGVVLSLMASHAHERSTTSKSIGTMELLRHRRVL